MKKTSLYLSFVLMLQGCAYLIHGETQNLEIETNPPGLFARVETIQCKTPCIMEKVPRRAERIYILQDGIEREFPLTKSLNIGAELLNVFNYGIGTAIDFPSGAARTIKPVKIDMAVYSPRSAQGASSGAPF